MKKTLLILSAVICSLIINAQTNLLTNPSFEEWTDGVPTGWSIVGTPTGYTVSEETTIVLDGEKSFKVDVPSAASGTISWSQSISSLTPGETYTLSMSYYIASGDGTDARIWCNFKAGDSFFADADLQATGQYSKLRGPGNENSSGSSYFPDEKGEWKTYTIDVTMPDKADGFDFQFRTYKGAVVYWDKCSFTEKNTSGYVNPTFNNPSFYVSGNELIVNNLTQGTVVEFYNALGAKVQSQVYSGNAIPLSDLAKGVYVIRAGKFTQKIAF